MRIDVNTRRPILKMNTGGLSGPAVLPVAVRIARKTLTIVHQNIWFALAVKFLVLFLSAIGRANMWMAVFADVGVSVIAILNAGRMLKAK